MDRYYAVANWKNYNQIIETGGCHNSRCSFGAVLFIICKMYYYTQNRNTVILFTKLMKNQLVALTTS